MGRDGQIDRDTTGLDALNISDGDAHRHLVGDRLRRSFVDELGDRKIRSTFTAIPDVHADLFIARDVAGLCVADLGTVCSGH